ncbi:MAG: SDR family oxidoreductase [Anaerolineaceae bacterium]|jgi:NAD(P)-dependent dehydrogenase (short-subunit alcohol dehydrogenase family)
MPSDLQVKPLALVTGAAIRLGREIALALADQGYAIGLHYNTSVRQAQALSRQLEDNGVPTLLLQADLTFPDQIRRIFEQVSVHPSPLQILVNSAAVMQAVTLEDTSVEDWDATFDLNLRAPWLCSRYAAQLMKENGVIINLTDAASGRPWKTYPAYSVSKVGLEVLTRILARSLAPGIRVNAVAPGLVMPTPDLPDDQWERLVERLPAKRTGTPQDIVKAVLFLIQNEYITGQTLVVDGGYQLI